MDYHSDGSKIPQWIALALSVQGIILLMIGLPLIFIPLPVLIGAGWLQPDPLTARLLGSALVSLGGGSVMCTQANRKTVYQVLNFFLLFESLAVCSLFYSVLDYEQQRPAGAMVMAGVFTLFSMVWAYARGRLHWDNEEDDF
jgi:hypothetical protein